MDRLEDWLDRLGERLDAALRLRLERNARVPDNEGGEEDIFEVLNGRREQAQEALEALMDYSMSEAKNPAIA